MEVSASNEEESPKKADAFDPDAVDKRNTIAKSIWELDLRDAIKIGLDNSEAARVIQGDKTEPTLVCPVDSKIPAEKFEADTAALAASIAQKYWAFQMATVNRWARKTACDEVRVVKQRNATMKILFDRPNCSSHRSEELAASFDCEYEEAQAEHKSAERELRKILGLPEMDSREILPISTPRQDRVSIDLVACLKDQAGENCPDDPSAEHGKAERRRTIVRLAREVENQYCHLKIAETLKAFAKQEHLSLKERYERGEISSDSYFEALDEWVTSVAEESKSRAKYNTALAQVDQWKGTLLAKYYVFLTPRVEIRKGEASTVVFRSSVHSTNEWVQSLDSIQPPTDDAEIARASTNQPAAKPVVFDGDRLGCVEMDDEDDDEETDPFGSLAFRILSPTGMVRYDGEVGVGTLGDEAVTLRVPTSGGGVVEITAKMVKKPTNSPTKAAK